MAMAGIRPPFDRHDEEKSFLWAEAWAGFGEAADSPQPGDVLVFKFSGSDHHVTLFSGLAADGSYICVGGNQSHQVKVSNYPKTEVEAIRRPPSAGAMVGSSIAWPPSVHHYVGITATVFGGSGDPNHSRYDNHLINDSELGVALPYHFPNPVPKVICYVNGKSVVCDIVDVGPWNTNDPYWQTGARPQAETGTDMSGRHTNFAGIDLTPAAARSLGIDGKGKVDWEFAGAGTMPSHHDPDQQKQAKQPSPDLIGMLLDRIRQLEAKMSTSATGGANQSLPQLDLTRIEQDIARLGQIAASFSQFAGKLGTTLPTDGLPPQIQQIEQSITRLGQIAGNLAQVTSSLPLGQVQPDDNVTSAPILSPIDKLFGGQAMVGLKTPIAIFGYVGLWILQALGSVGTATGDTATTTGSVLTALFSGLGAAGVTAKFDRAFQALSLISGALQKLPALSSPVLPPSGK
jgi:hypothetical protein